MHPELSYYYYVTLFWSFDLWHVMDVLPILLREDTKIWRNDFTLMHPKVGAKRLFLKAVEEIKTTLSQWLSVNPIAEPSSSKSYYWNLPLLSICFCPDKGLFSWPLLEWFSLQLITLHKLQILKTDKILAISRFYPDKGLFYWPLLYWFSL